MKSGQMLTNRSFVLPMFYLALAGITWLILGRANEADANFVAYRFAANLAAGRGLVYWTPGAVISTYPLVPALLAILALVGIPLPVAGGLLSIGAAAVGAISLMRLCQDYWAAGAAYVLVVMVQPSPVVLIMLALALTGLAAARHTRWLWAGIWIGLAILAEPSAVLLAILMLIYVVRLNGSTRLYLLPVALCLAGMLGLAGLSQTSLISVVPGLATALLPLVAILVLFRRWSVLRELPMYAVLLAWSALIALFALVAGTMPTAAIVPGLIALGSLTPVPVLALAACADMLIGLLLTGPFTASPSAQALGQWIAANTQPGATLATMDTGVLAFYANRPVIDLSGAIQPDTFDQTFFLRRAPDVIVLPHGQTVPWQAFATTYAQTQVIDNRAVYQPVVHFSELDPHAADMPYGLSAIGRDDLHLTGVELGSILHPGDLARIRLDWQLAYIPYADVRINLALRDDQGSTVAAASDLVPVSLWRTGAMSTYHLLVLPGNIASGNVSLNLSLSVAGGLSPDARVAMVNVQ